MVAESSLEKKELGDSHLERSFPTQRPRLEEEYGRRSRGYLLTKKGITSNYFPHHTSFFCIVIFGNTKHKRHMILEFSDLFRICDSIVLFG